MTRLVGVLGYATPAPSAAADDLPWQCAPYVQWRTGSASATRTVDGACGPQRHVRRGCAKPVYSLTPFCVRGRDGTCARQATRFVNLFRAITMPEIRTSETGPGSAPNPISSTMRSQLRDSESASHPTAPSFQAPHASLSISILTYFVQTSLSL